MKSAEAKIAEAISNSVDDHYFNPAVVGRLLVNNPSYTVDRIVELVTHVIRNLSRQHSQNCKAGKEFSEGSFLASELNVELNKLIKKYKWQNMKLPK